MNGPFVTIRWLVRERDEILKSLMIALMEKVTQILFESIRIANPSMRSWGKAGKLVGCQDAFACAAFQTVGVNSAMRLIGHAPSLGSTSLR